MSQNCLIVQACKAYFYSLFCSGANLSFHMIQYHFYSDNASTKDIVVYSCLDRQIEYDIVILHSVPEHWPVYVREERRRNPNVLIVGLTVWETSKLHTKWVDCMSCVDLIITPCSWNRNVFAKQVKLPIYTVLNPIQDLAEPDPRFVLDRIRDQDFVFYSINEWTPRKGIEDLVNCFLDSFTAKDNVVLYIKTSAIKRERAEAFISNRRVIYADPPEIFLNCADLTDAEISAIHRRGQAYVSLCKSEGMMSCTFD